jgi:tetratricopeptide (TPR) repeat protein
MDTASKFLVYALLFRLAVIGVGVLSIVLGYRLFLKGVVPPKGSDASLKGGGLNLTLRNAAPGTTFALFGAVLVGGMLLEGSPSMVMENLQESEANTPLSSRLAMRSNGAPRRPLPSQPAASRVAAANEAKLASEAARQLVTAGLEAERRNDIPGATHLYQLALMIPQLPLQEAAAPLNQLAWIYHSSQPEKALALGRLALELKPETPTFMDTLARIYLEQGDTDQALALAQRAAQVSPEEADLLVTLALALEAGGAPEEARHQMQQAVALDARFLPELQRLETRLAGRRAGHKDEIP